MLHFEDFMRAIESGSALWKKYFNPRFPSLYSKEPELKDSGFCAHTFFESFEDPGTGEILYRHKKTI
ncbi:MAG: hypothetical protein MUP55_00320 [Candidatus Aenigmarchaeota archaeon]|nr:hypothetical protein [Candidatus Aenigmarchaeota archaeon]